jgi:hypothetical protein
MGYEPDTYNVRVHRAVLGTSARPDATCTAQRR